MRVSLELKPSLSVVLRKARVKRAVVRGQHFERLADHPAHWSSDNYLVLSDGDDKGEKSVHDEQR